MITQEAAQIVHDRSAPRGRAVLASTQAPLLPETSPRNYPGSCPQREPRRPKSLAQEALIYEALFVARWLLSRFEKGS